MSVKIHEWYEGEIVNTYQFDSREDAIAFWNSYLRKNVVKYSIEETLELEEEDVRDCSSRSRDDLHKMPESRQVG